MSSQVWFNFQSTGQIVEVLTAMALRTWIWTGWLEAGPQELAGWPSHGAPSQDVDVEMVDRLASIRSIVHHDPVAISQTLVFGDFLRYQHQVAQQLV